MTVTALHVPDLHCADCAARIRRAVADDPALESARINPITRNVFVTHDGNALVPFEAIERAGFHPRLTGAQTPPDHRLLMQFGVAAICAMR